MTCMTCMTCRPKRRLQKYSALAAAPCAALGGLAVGGISVEATAGVTTTVAAGQGHLASTWNSQAVFAAGGIDFNVFAFFSSNNSASMGLSIDDRQDAGQMQFWSGGTQSKVISSGATGAGLTNNGYGGSQVNNFNLLGTGDTGSNRYLGFFVQHTPSSNYVAGWINFDFDRSSGQRSFTINSYSVDVAGSGATITMPANSGGGAVPGIGGLAGLAMGAAGLRRKRQRVA
jgi:hypothetical protein